MNISTISHLQFLQAAIRMMPPIALSALGAVLTGRSGMLIFAFEGMMLTGSFLAVIASYLFANSWIGVLAAIISGMIFAGIFAYFYLKYDIDLIILSIAFNILASELTVFFLKVITGNEGSFNDPRIVSLPEITIPVISQTPILRELFNGYNLIVYLTYVIVIACYLLLYHTPFGRHVRATGENIQAARTAGINVNRVRTITLLISGALSGLGGAYLSVGHLSLFSKNMTGGRGFTGLVAAIFADNHPIWTFFTSLFFGAADSIAIRIQSLESVTIPADVILMLPHVLTLLAITTVGIRVEMRKNTDRRKLKRLAKQLIHKDLVG